MHVKLMFTFFIHIIVCSSKWLETIQYLSTKDHLNYDKLQEWDSILNICYVRSYVKEYAYIIWKDLLKEKKNYSYFFIHFEFSTILIIYLNSSIFFLIRKIMVQ